MPCRVLIFVAVLSVAVSAIVPIDSNRNILTVRNAACSFSCVEFITFTADGLCVRRGDDSSYMATCNASTGSFHLQQFLSPNCEGKRYRNINSDTRNYNGPETDISASYVRRSLEEGKGEVKYCPCKGADCQTKCVCKNYEYEVTTIDCKEYTLGEHTYYANGYYDSRNRDYIYMLFDSKTDCLEKNVQLGVLPTYWVDMYEHENEQCVPYAEQYTTKCTPVTQTMSPSASVPATPTASVPATPTQEVPRTATATATLPTTTPASTTTPATTPASTTPATTPASTTTPATTPASTTPATTTNATPAGARVDGGSDDDGGSKGVCIPCIVVPIVVVLLLLCIALIIWLLCCRRRDEVKVLDDVEFEAVPNPLHEANGENYYSANPSHEANGENYYSAHPNGESCPTESRRAAPSVPS